MRLVGDLLDNSSPHYHFVDKMSPKLSDKLSPIFSMVRFVDGGNEVGLEGRNSEEIDGKFISLAFCHGMSQSHIGFDGLFLHLFVCC